MTNYTWEDNILEYTAIMFGALVIFAGGGCIVYSKHTITTAIGIFCIAIGLTGCAGMALIIYRRKKRMKHD